MKENEKLKLLGQLFCLFDPSKERTLRNTIIWKMMLRVEQGKNPVLETYYNTAAMPEPYIRHQDAIWKYLVEFISKEKDSYKSPVLYAAEHYHKPFMSSTSMGFQSFAEMMINITYLRMSQEILKKIKKNMR